MNAFDDVPIGVHSTLPRSMSAESATVLPSYGFPPFTSSANFRSCAAVLTVRSACESAKTAAGRTDTASIAARSAAKKRFAFFFIFPP